MIILGIFLLNQIRTGGDRRCLELLELLAERGNRVIVLTNCFLDYRNKHFIKIDLPIKYVLHRFPPASWLFRKHIKKNITAIRAELVRLDAPELDFIHIHGDTHLKAALWLQRCLKTPLFYAFRSNDIDRAHILRTRGRLGFRAYFFSLLNEPINRFREKQAARFAELLTFQNVPDRDRFLRRTGCPEEKTVIIPGNIGPPRCAPEWQQKNASQGVEKIVYVGSLSADKGLWGLLKALALLKKRGFSNLKCSLLGRAETIDKTVRLVKNLGIAEMVSFEGYQDPFPYLVSGDLMVYPTLYDAYPDTVLESLHAGCPVIASSVGGLPDLLRYPELLFESGNIEEMASRIERCITDSVFYRRLRALCADRAQAHRFDWAERFEKAMAEFLERESQVSPQK
ncbi:MAG: glycosyltransferase family 4 protein [Treponema sp.]|jgi:glycosyltransferase involved in cell wall biosynthesis|nr:glycosyltransferase family 4 protein [Treponema sp.]